MPPSPTTYLRLSVTDRCNYRCRYCQPDGPGALAPAPLDDDALVALVGHLDDARPIRKVRITGGEPLLRPGIERLAATMRARLPAAELCLTTNGSRLERAAQGLRDAGIDRINVSLDAARPETFAAVTGGAALAPVLRGIAAARRAGFERPRLNAVLMRSVNASPQDVEALVRTASAEGCELRFIELMPLGPAAAFAAHEMVGADEVERMLAAAFDDLGPTDGSDTARRRLWRVDGQTVVVGFVSPVSRPFCAWCDRLRLDSRGRLVGCLRKGAGVDLAPLLGPGDAAVIRDAIAKVIADKALPGACWAERRMAAIGG